MTWAALIPVIAGYLASLWIIVQSINKRIDGLESRVGNVDNTLGGISRSLGVIEERTATIVARMDQHEAEFRELRRGKR